MTSDTSTFKTILEAELARVTEDLSTLGVHDPENPDNWVVDENMSEGEADPDLVADRTEEWDERVATLALLETEYNNIKRALKNIAAGTYGTCEVGGEPIEEQRLLANPHARTCIAHMDDEAMLPL